MKHRENFSSEELSAFLAEIDALHNAYASAAERDALQGPMPDEWEDETELLHRAALSRGQP